MCGGDLSVQDYRDRFGALAVLRPSPDASLGSSGGWQGLSGSIVFFNDKDHDGQVATHLRFLPSGFLACDQDQHQCLFVNIHEFGDLSLPHASNGAVDDAIALWPEHSVAGQPGSALRRLDQPLYLHVGHDRHGNNGIIGRRVTVCCASSTEGRPAVPAVLAEGIVGYNRSP